MNEAIRFRTELADDKAVGRPNRPQRTMSAQLWDLRIGRSPSSLNVTSTWPRLTTQLKQAGVPVWVGTEAISYGDRWEQRIRDRNGVTSAAKW